MGRSFSRLMGWLAVVAITGSFLATVYHKNVLTVDQFLYALFMFWVLFFSGVILLLAFFREGRKKSALSLKGVVSFAPALQVKKAKRNSILPLLLLPAPEGTEKKEENTKNEMSARGNAETGSIDKLQEKEAQSIAHVIRHTWLTS